MGRNSPFAIVAFLVGLAVIAFGLFYGVPHLPGVYSRRDLGEVWAWIITFGVGICTFLIMRSARTRETRLTLLGLTVAFAAVGYGIFLSQYLQVDGVLVGLMVGGLMAVALVLVGGGVADGLIGRRAGEPGRPDRKVVEDEL